MKKQKKLAKLKEIHEAILKARSVVVKMQHISQDFSEPFLLQLPCVPSRGDRITLANALFPRTYGYGSLGSSTLEVAGIEYVKASEGSTQVYVSFWAIS